MAKDRTLSADEHRLWRQAMGEEPKEKAPAKMAGAPPSKKSPVKKSPPPLEVQSGRQAARTLKPAGKAEAVLDLHGMGKIEAYGLVQDFIARAHKQGKRHLLIITGKGRTSEGILRASLPHWLNEPALRRRIGNVTHATPEKGGSGVFHVLLRRSAKD